MCTVVVQLSCWEEECLLHVHVAHPFCKSRLLLHIACRASIAQRTKVPRGSQLLAQRQHYSSTLLWHNWWHDLGHTIDALAKQHAAQSAAPIGEEFSLRFFLISFLHTFSPIFWPLNEIWSVCIHQALHFYSFTPSCEFFISPFLSPVFFFSASTSDPSVTLEVSICQAVRHSDKSSSGSGFLGLVVASQLSSPSSPHQARCPDGERRRQLGSGIRFAVLYRNAEDELLPRKLTYPLTKAGWKTIFLLTYWFSRGTYGTYRLCGEC